MSNKNIDLLGNTIGGALQNSKQILTDISKTCCMPERSPNINEAKDLIDKLIAITREMNGEEHKVHRCIEDIGALGSKIGYLYATCCTETREPMYQGIFKDLMTINAGLWSTLGHSH